MNKCDIIIPIYNAYEYVIRCIDTVIKNTDLSTNTLILINDKSSDSRMNDLLKNYAKNNKGIKIIENEENLGFVGTVNRGMKESKSDVLLLNSDTEVPPHWLDNIKKAAYSKPMVGTVTPLSNNATLVSVTKPLVENNLPVGYSFEEYAKIVEKIAYNDNNEIPTGHGFCMFIKREVLDVVGYFDVESFEKGYGEENDFCYRCLDCGYRNIVCDNTIVFHNEAKSFSGSRDQFVKEGMEVLTKKHPFYKVQTEKVCEHKVNKYIGKNINYYINSEKNKKNILILIHDWKDIKNNLGGTTLHVYDLIQNLKDKYNFHILTPEDGVFKLYSYWRDGEDVLIFPGIASSYSKYNFYNDEYKEMLENIVSSFDIHGVHIHHLKDQYFDIIDVIKEKHLKSIITLHDFYAVCPLINKLFENRKYCGNGDSSKCQVCLKRTIGNSENFVECWRKEWKRLLTTVDHIIVPSENAKTEIHKTFPELNIKAIEHGIDIKKEVSKLTIKGIKTFDIAFVGAIGIHKGAIILEDLVKAVKGTNIRVHLFGISSSDFLKSKQPNFIDHGKYKRKNLPDLLKNNGIKLICSFSIWPETYSYTLTENIACGIPVLALDIGAVSERVRKYNLGWLIPFNSKVDTIIKKLNEIFKNKTGYDRVIKAINKYEIKTTKEMANEYITMYDELTDKVSDYDIEKIKKIVKIGSSEYKVSSNSNVDWIFNTLKWKLMSSIKVPKTISNIVRKIIK